MKMMCYAVLFIALLIYYQSQPIFTIIIVVLIFGAYFLLKSKKGGSNLISTVLRSGKPEANRSDSNELIKFLVLQQILNSQDSRDEGLSFGEVDRSDFDERALEIEGKKQRILSLFED